LGIKLSSLTNPKHFC